MQPRLWLGQDLAWSGPGLSLGLVWGLVPLDKLFPSEYFVKRFYLTRNSAVSIYGFSDIAETERLSKYAERCQHDAVNSHVVSGGGGGSWGWTPILAFDVGFLTLGPKLGPSSFV